MERLWWKNGVVYQIYPRSFCDANGDGIGDLRGIISKIDYLKSLGVDIVWLSPIFASPNDDNGYDISDYHDIMAEFGSMQDFEELVRGLHEAGIKLILDLVVNHTSDEHAWFCESRKSKDNAFRDYYIWREGKDGQPPNNWTSFFTGSAWQLDNATGQYYLHLFSKKQPDLNWDNPVVRDEVKKIIKFWLDAGADGFRCDVINLISKREGLPDGKKRGELVGVEHYLNGPNVHTFLKELKKDVLSNYDCFTVGEMMGEVEEILKYTDPSNKELDMAINFDHMNADNKNGIKWFPKRFCLVEFKRACERWQNTRGWIALYLENHDQPRSVSRFGSDGEFHSVSAKMLPVAMFFQQGTPFVYQGQEIGMTNAGFKKLSDYRDVETHNVFKIGKRRFIPAFELMRRIRIASRDNARTPMQWDSSANAGFSTAEPWLKVTENYQKINVKAQENDSGSILSFYKRLIALRKKYDVIYDGKFRLLLPQSKSIFAYERENDSQKLLVVTNFCKKEIECPAEIELFGYDMILCNYEDGGGSKLRPYEARVYFCKK